MVEGRDFQSGIIGGQCRSQSCRLGQGQGRLGRRLGLQGRRLGLLGLVQRIVSRRQRFLERQQVGQLLGGLPGGDGHGFLFYHDTFLILLIHYIPFDLIGQPFDLFIHFSDVVKLGVLSKLVGCRSQAILALNCSPVHRVRVLFSYICAQLSGLFIFIFIDICFNISCYRFRYH